MQFNTYLKTSSELKLLKKTSIREVILEHKTLSRMGKLETKSLLSLTELALASGMSPLLQWDILSTEPNFQRCISVLKHLPLEKFRAIRLQDLGAAEWIRQQYPELPLHWIVETGNHNLTALQRWSEYFGPQLQRLVLSTELPGTVLNEYSQILPVPCEILAVGRILLFYTPRNLFSVRLAFQNSTQPVSNFMEKILLSEGQPQQQFPTVENQHGTFMFHHRDLFLLDLLPKLQKTKLEVLRLDLRHLKNFAENLQKINKLLESFDKQKAAELKAQWPVKITHGFFQANRTERRIERLKNPHRQDHGENHVADVLEALKSEHLILLSRKVFRRGESLRGITPEGRECEVSTEILHTASGEAVTETIPGKLYQVPHVKYVTAQTLLYRRFER